MTLAHSAPATAERPMLAIGLRLGAMAMLSTMFMLVKVAGERGVSLPELMFWRQAMSVPILCGWLALTGQLRKLATRRLGSHGLRATVGTAGLCCNLGAATFLPLPMATTLGFTTPLFAVVLSAFVLRQRVGPWRWSAVALGFAGVLAVAQPGGAHAPPLGVAFGLGAGVIVAMVSFQIRDLARTEEPISCVFWFAFFGALFAAILLPFYARPHATGDWLLLIAIGLAGTLAQFFLTAALKFGQVATVVVMDYSALIWSTFYGWAIWGALPVHAMWIGVPLIVSAGLIITWREHRLARSVSPTSALDEGATEEAAPLPTLDLRRPGT